MHIKTSNHSPLFINWLSVNRLIHFSLNLGNDNDDNKDGDDDDDDDNDVDNDDNDTPWMSYTLVRI